jgi:exosortase
VRAETSQAKIWPAPSKLMAAGIQRGSMCARHACFLGLIVAAIGLFHRALFFVVGASISVDQYSHILLVVPVSAALLYGTRKRTLGRVAYNTPAGLSFLFLIGCSAFAAGHESALTVSTYLSLSILLFAGCCASAFAFCYGADAFRVAVFPLLFLLLMAPLPDSVLERVVASLQNGSAVTACLLFRLAHIPYVRHGVVVALPRIDIYVAEECSGIRSSMVLLLCTLVLGQLYLKSFWAKTLLTLTAVPIMVAKNGLRIFVLSTLGMYVDPSFLSGRLHHEGGFIFFGLAFAGVFLLIWLFQKLGLDPGTTGSAASNQDLHS